jgi:hypothetical protein
MLDRPEVLMTETARSCFEPLPRERWAEHPRFPSQVLLLGSHQNFRRISKALVASAPASLEARQRLFDQWQAAMRSHEHYEERKLYPFLRHRFGVKTVLLEEGHAALHTIERELRRAFDADDQAAWAKTMARYDVVLHEHLRDEEDLVIPCLLALEPREFSAYYHGSLAELLADTAACNC